MRPASLLTLCFLGQRDYLHGTTLFDALRPWYQHGTHLRLKLGRLMKTDRVRVQQLLEATGTAGNYSATLSWKGGDQEYRIGVAPMEPSVAPERLPFDEESIIARGRFGDRTVVLTNPKGESLIRTLVALNKALLFRAITPQSAGQWLFTRLELEAAPISFHEVILQLRSSAGMAAVTSSIEVDGQSLGTIMFSWLKR